MVISRLARAATFPAVGHHYYGDPSLVETFKNIKYLLALRCREVPGLVGKYDAGAVGERPLQSQRAAALP